MITIEKGSKVIGNWGAMFPIMEGEINHITADGMCVITWDSDEDLLQNFMLRKEEIHQPGWKSVNGSTIGIFLVQNNS